MPTSSTKSRPPPEKLIPSIQSKLRKLILRSASANITLQDPVVKATYLGNLVTTWAKGDGCLDRPSNALWKNHVQRHASIRMTVVVTPGGLKAETREHGLTEYWNNRLTWCGVPIDFPKLFCWIYRHETRKLKQELRCHAVICNNKDDAHLLSEALRYRLAESLFDFRKEKLQRQNARLSSLSLNSYNSNNNINNNNNSNNNNGYYVQDTQSLNNYRRERPSPSKLSIIEESAEEDNYSPTLRATYDQVMQYFELRSQNHYNKLSHHQPTNSLSSSTTSSSETEEVSDSSGENSEDENPSSLSMMTSSSSTNNNNNNHIHNNHIHDDDDDDNHILQVHNNNVDDELCSSSINEHKTLVFEDICYDI